MVSESSQSRRRMFEEDDSKRRQGAGYRMSSAMQGNRCRFHASAIAPVMSPIDGRIAIQEFLPVAASWRSYSIIGTGNRGEVADNENDVVGCTAFSHQADDTRFGILTVDPFDAGRVDISFMKRRFPAIGVIEIRDPPVHALMERKFQRTPLQLTVVGPLSRLTEFASHEHEFLGGLGVHMPEQQAEVGEFLPFIPRHFPQ